jgi:hypothetical protein
VQKFSTSPSFLSPSAIDAAFQRAHAELNAAEAAAIAEEAALGPDPDPVDDAAERLLVGDALLHVARAPVEWLLALAHRLAAGDSDHVAALDRLNAAFHSRLAGRSIGVRGSDVLTAFGILVGALDRVIVLESATTTIADGVATILACEEVSLAAQLADLVSALPVAVQCVHVARPRRRRPGASSHGNHR